MLVVLNVLSEIGGLENMHSLRYKFTVKLLRIVICYTQS